MRRTHALMLVAAALAAASAGCGGAGEAKGPLGPFLGQPEPGPQPEIFAPGIVSTGLNEGACSFSPDGREMIFHLVYRKEHELMVSLTGCREVDGAWKGPEILSFSGARQQDMYPFLSYHGESLYFVSNRPTNRPELVNTQNFWVAKRAGEGWGHPEPLGPPINGRGDVSGISVSLDGGVYFTLIGEEEQAIYRSQLTDGVFSEPVRLPETVNSTASQFDGVIAPDESYMILCVYGRDDSIGSTDLYVTFRDGEDNWSPVVNMGPRFNTPHVDGPATISADGKYIFFSGYLQTNTWFENAVSYDDITRHYSKPGFGSSDVYWVDAGVVEEMRP